MNEGAFALVLLNGRDLSGRPLFLVHPVGGTVAGYHDLAKRLSVPVYAFENQRPAPIAPKRPSSVNEMARDYLPALLNVQPRGPYVLGGYSMGGVVAFELACLLRQAGHEVECVITFDTPVRVQPPIDTPTELATSRIMAMAKFVGSRSREITLVEEEVERIPAAGRLEFFIAELKRQKAFPPNASSVMLTEMMMTSVHNEDLQRRYVPGMFDRAIFLLRALTPDPLLQAETGATYDDPSFGWQAVTSAPVEIVWVPGQHLSIMHPPEIDVIAAEVQRRLDRREPQQPRS